MTENSAPVPKVHVQGKYTSSKSCSEVVRDLGSISVLDKTSESEMSGIESKKKTGCGVMGVGGFLIFLAIYISSEFNVEGGGVGFLAILGFLLLASAFPNYALPLLL